MKKVNNFLTIAFFTACIGVFSGCKKDAEIPTLTTIEVSTNTSSTATSGGIVTSNGSGEVTAHGVCWSITPNPSIADSKTTDGQGSGTFASTMTGLTLNIKYYVRAYATNSAGTGYGNEVSFTMRLPATLTTEIESSTSTYAVSLGNITDDGGSTISERGVCWSTSQNPTTADSKTIDEIHSMTFICNLRSLIPGTTYFVRAYAINLAGTAYGNQLSFTTDAEVDPIIFGGDLTYGSVSDIEGNIYKTIQIGSRNWMAENLRTTKFNDGNAIPLVTSNTDWSTLTSPGYCWYNNDPAVNKEIYGALYNWSAVTSGKLCPAGWHLPDRSDFDNLNETAGPAEDAGSNLKESGTSHWSYPNDATNSTGWTALPGGFRSVDGSFEESLGLYGFWWLTDELLSPNAIYAVLSYDNSILSFLDTYENWTNGVSVRCVKN